MHFLFPTDVEFLRIKNRDVDLHRFIYALGIRQVGQATAKRLASHYISLSNLRATLDHDALLEIEDIGPAVAKDIIAFFNFFS